MQNDARGAPRERERTRQPHAARQQAEHDGDRQQSSDLVHEGLPFEQLWIVLRLWSITAEQRTYNLQRGLPELRPAAAELILQSQDDAGVHLADA